jgi:hypothetical protein
MGLKLKLWGFLFTLLIMNSTVAQSVYIVGEPISDSLDSLSWFSNGECNADGNPDFTLEFVDSEVTGLSYVFILTQVSPSNSVYTNQAGIINTGDTLMLDGLVHSFYFPDTSVLKGTFKMIGTPQVEDEQYSCEDILWIHTLSDCFNTFEYFFDPNNDIVCDVKPSCYTEQTQTIATCDSYYWQADSTTYSTSGIYSKMLSTTSGCDSLVKLDLTVNESFFTVDEIFACDSYTWIDGITYSSSNDSATHLLTSVEGCDSLIQLDLTIIQELNTNIQVISQDEYVILTAVENQMQYQWLDCGDNFTPIPNETSQTFIPSTTGNYAFLLTDSNCTDTSDCVFVNLVGLDEWESARFDLFPNPNKGEFEIKNKTGVLTDIYIVDAIGKVVHSQKLKTSQHKVQADLPGGIYMVHFIQNDSKTILRMVVK